VFEATDLTRVSPVVDGRACTFENPTGARGAGGRAANGRKGAPFGVLAAGETVTLADVDGPGVVRHIWMTFPPARPEVMRAMVLEVFYDGATEPSVSVPALDFFGVAMGRPATVNSALASIQEARGFNSYIPMPFESHLRITFRNASAQPIHLYYQVDFTLEPLAPDTGRLHATFRRENPTTLKRDFVIEEGLRGPGRFLGCVVGIRTIDGGFWYGEGEVKVFRDGDTELPTICGTGLEDYVGTAWGMEEHLAHYAGVPLSRGVEGSRVPDWVSFYRWHVLDPIMFDASIKVTIQQIGYDGFFPGDEARLQQFEDEGRIAGNGLNTTLPNNAPSPFLGHGIVERVDDYCAVAFTMCRDAQPVPRVDAAVATADLERREYEQPNPMELMFLAGAG
jgi:hypothetical protein